MIISKTFKSKFCISDKLLILNFKDMELNNSIKELEYHFEITNFTNSNNEKGYCIIIVIEKYSKCNVCNNYHDIFFIIYDNIFKSFNISKIIKQSNKYLVERKYFFISNIHIILQHLEEFLLNIKFNIIEKCLNENKLF